MSRESKLSKEGFGYQFVLEIEMPFGTNCILTER